MRDHRSRILCIYCHYKCVDRNFLLEYYMNMNTTIQIRTNLNLKNKVQKVLKKRNISLSLAMNSFLSEIVHSQSFPVTVNPIKDIPAHAKRSWREEMEKEVKTSKRYKGVDDMWADIDNQ